MKITQHSTLLNNVAVTGASASLPMRNGEDVISVYLVTSGTVALTVDVEALCPGTANWHKIGSSGALTTVGNQPVITIQNVVANEIRLNVSARTNGNVTGTVCTAKVGA